MCTEPMAVRPYVYEWTIYSSTAVVVGYALHIKVFSVSLVSRASRSTSILVGKERLVTFARYLWHVGMQLLRDVIAYTFAPTCFDEMFA